MQTLTRTVSGRGVSDIRVAAVRLNRTFDRIRNFSDSVLKNTGVLLMCSGKALMNYKTQDSLISALSAKGATLLKLESNLKFLADALEQYELIYSDLFKGRGAVLVGDPEVEVPMIQGTDKKITDEWVKNLVVSNIFNCAMALNDSIALEVLLKDVPIQMWKETLRRGGALDWDLQSAHETFLTLYLLEEAMNENVVRTMLDESVPLHEISGAVLRYAESRGIPLALRR